MRSAHERTRHPTMKMLPGLALLSMFVFGAGARADLPRQPVKLADLPEAVRRTVLQQKGQANIFRLEKTFLEGNEIYQLVLRTGLGKKTVLIDAGGRFLEIKQPMKWSEVSPAARNVIVSSVANGNILSLESVKIASGIIAAYEVRFTKEGKQAELRIGPDGSLPQN